MFSAFWAGLALIEGFFANDRAYRALFAFDMKNAATSFERMYLNVKVIYAHFLILYILRYAAFCAIFRWIIIVSV